MDMRSLGYLASLAEHGSLTAAARARYVTQPAVSIALRRLGDELGAPLYEADGRKVRLTDAGRRVLDYARRFAALDAELRREIADLGELRSGRLAIGTIDAASIYVLPDVFARYGERYPGIDVHLEIAATAPLLASLRAGRIDLAVGSLPLEGGEGLTVAEFFREEMLLIAPPGDPLADRRRHRASSLIGRSFISFHDGSVTRRIIEERLRERGVEPRIAMAIDSPEAIMNLVAAGLGLAVLPERVVQDDIERGRVWSIEVAGLSFERRLGLIVRSEGYLPRPLRAFLDEVERERGVALPRGFARNHAMKGDKT